MFFATLNLKFKQRHNEHLDKRVKPTRHCLTLFETVFVGQQLSGHVRVLSLQRLTDYIKRDRFFSRSKRPERKRVFCF